MNVPQQDLCLAISLAKSYRNVLHDKQMLP